MLRLKTRWSERENPGLAPCQSRARPNPRFSRDLGVAEPHKLHQLLRCGLIAVEAKASLLRHRPTISGRRCLHLLVDPRFRRAAAHLHGRLTGVAGRGLAANVVVAIA